MKWTAYETQIKLTVAIGIRARCTNTLIPCNNHVSVNDTWF